jgi:hypothetical protein
MITVIRASGLRVIIFTDDHEPAHVHVFGDGHAKINLLDDPELVWAESMTRTEVRKAMRLVSDHQSVLLA